MVKAAASETDLSLSLEVPPGSALARIWPKRDRNAVT